MTPFERIERGLRDVLAVTRGEKKPVRLCVPPEIDVRAIRTKAKMSQDRFASSFGFSVHQIRQWEQGRSRPLGPERAYLMLIDHDPKIVLQFLHEALAAQRAAA